MGDGELSVRINMTEVVESAWDAYQEKSGIGRYDAKAKASRKKAFVSGVFAGLEIGRGVAAAAREAAFDEHVRASNELKRVMREA